MQLWKTSAAMIYLGSYLPLAIILLAQDIDFVVIRGELCLSHDILIAKCEIPLKHAFVSVVILGICLGCFVFSLIALKYLPAKHKIKIIESKHIPSDLINYVVPYVLSFISMDYGDVGKVLGFLIFMGWIFWITYKSGQIVMNPILTVLGWRLYEVKYSFVGSTDVLIGRALSQCDLQPSAVYRHSALQDVLVVREDLENNCGKT